MMMKSLSTLALDIDEATYRADSAISYSTMSKFEREGWRKMSSLFDKIDSPALVFGSAVDTLITDGQEAFDERFIVCSFPSLSDTLISITRSLHRKFNSTHRKISTIPEQELDNAAIEFNYYANPRYAALRVKNIKEGCDEYYSLLTLAGDKTILSQSDYEDVIKCVEELRLNPITSYYFTPSESENIEKLFQLKFKADYDGTPVRCMFDLLVVDHEHKIIYPKDLKTTGHPEEEFQESFATWRYDIQAKLYTYILQETINKDPYFKDFSIAPWEFIVINRRTVAPLLWTFPGNFSQVDLKDSNGKIYRDWRKILADLMYYLSNPNMKYSKEAQENEGILLINNLKAV